MLKNNSSEVILSIHFEKNGLLTHLINESNVYLTWYIKLTSGLLFLKALSSDISKRFSFWKGT